MEKISANEILGTIRAGLKMYQAFEQLNKVVSFLEQQESYEKHLKLSVSELEKTEEGLTKSIESKSSQLEDLEKKSDELAADIESRLKKAEDDKANILEAGKTEAEKMVAKAKQDIANMADDTRRLKVEIQSLSEEREREKADLEKFREEYQREKDRIIKALRGV